MQSCQYAEIETTTVVSPQPTSQQWITFNIWAPPNSQIASLHPYIKFSSGSGYYDFYIASNSGISADGWVQGLLQVPTGITGLIAMGVGIHTVDPGPDWQGSIYVDSISW